MMRFIPLAVFAVMLGLLAFMLLGKNELPEMAAKPFPTVVLTSMDGKADWSASQLKGRVTLVNFFASWCVPCAAEMPELAAFKKEFPQVAIEGVAWNDDEKTLKAWLKKNGNPFAHVWLDPKGDATIALGMKGIPETLVVDAKGQIRYRVVGPVTKAVRADVLDPLVVKLSAEAKDAQ